MAATDSGDVTKNTAVLIDMASQPIRSEDRKRGGGIGQYTPEIKIQTSSDHTRRGIFITASHVSSVFSVELHWCVCIQSIYYIFVYVNN